LVQAGVDLVGRELDHRTEAVEDAGVADEDVKAAEGAGRRLDGPLVIFEAAHVALDGDDAGPQLIAQRAQLLRRDVEHDDPGAGGDEAPRHAPPDSRRRASDERARTREERIHQRKTLRWRAFTTT